MGRESRAAAAAVTPELGPVWLTLPVSKIDEANWLVTGVVTSETLDQQGEIVDYDAAKAVFTDGTWPGNIREMHKPEAVGTRVSIDCDDVNRIISLTAKVSKGAPQTWAKVLDKTLSMFSLGGKAAKRVVEKSAAGAVATRMFLGKVVEVSLVDNGANPIAKFDIVKSVDGVLVDAQPPEPQDALTAAVAKAVSALEQAVTKAADDEKHKTASGAEGKWYAGTDGKSFPIASAKDVSNAARALGRTTQDKATVKANIIRIAYAHDLVSGLPEAWKKTADQTPAAKVADATDVVKGGMEPYDIDQALTAISFVNRLMASEYWEARQASAADGHTDGPEVAQVAMLKAACDALLKFLQSEYEEQFEPAVYDAVSPAPSMDAGDLEAALVTADDVVELFMSSLTLVQKAGARHSKGDVAMIQQVHDLASSLGADCTEETTKVTKTTTGEPVEKAKSKGGLDCPKCDGSGDCAACDGSGTMSTDKKAADATDVQKLTAELETTKAQLVEHQATVAETAKTIATLTSRLESIEAQPQGGGPAKTAVPVDKALGGGSAEPEAGSAGAQIATLQKFADDNPGNDVIKSRVAQEIVKISLVTGTNRIAFGR